VVDEASFLATISSFSYNCILSVERCGVLIHVTDTFPYSSVSIYHVVSRVIHQIRVYCTSQKGTRIKNMMQGLSHHIALHARVDEF